MSGTIPDVQLDRRNVGADTQERFRYQAACVLYYALEMLRDGTKVAAVYTEQIEDVLIQLHSGKWIPVSIKSREVTGDPYGLGEATFYKPLARFAIYEKMCGHEMDSYIWAVSDHGAREELVKFFHHGGLDALSAKKRKDVLENVIAAAKDGWGYEIESTHAETAAQKMKKEVLFPLEEYDHSMVTHVMMRMKEMEPIPWIMVGERVRAAIDDVQQRSRSMYDLRVSSVFASNAENERARQQATRIDVLRLYSLFGHRQGQTFWTPAERALACFADFADDMSTSDLVSACACLGISRNWKRFAEEIVVVESSKQAAALLKFRSFKGNLQGLAKAIRRLSMHGGSSAMQCFRDWSTAREPRCLVTRSIGHPWYVEEMVKTVDEEVPPRRWIPVFLDRDILAMDADTQLEHAQLEICAHFDIELDDLDRLRCLQDSYCIVLVVDAESDVSDMARRITDALPMSFLVIQADPDPAWVGACVECPTPSLMMLKNSARDIHLVGQFCRSLQP
jgi:hypothetical protein